VSVGVTNGLYDIAAVLALQTNYSGARPERICSRQNIDWANGTKLRSAVLETLRLSACVFGPVRKIIVNDFKLGERSAIILLRAAGLRLVLTLVIYVPV